MEAKDHVIISFKGVQFIIPLVLSLVETMIKFDPVQYMIKPTLEVRKLALMVIERNQVL